MTTSRKKPDHARQIAAIREKLPALDAAVEAAQGALDAALIAGSDSRPYRSHYRTSKAARAKADSALAAIEAEQASERQTAIVAAARAIEKKSHDARAKLLKKFEFSLELHA
ncbi:MAG: hypothetical protein E6R10_07185 [Rhodocyclaceae bacterium]|nr:MAG: hypothetical protein E6R10_07185 [Rhodocyclaceae bacterium]